MITLYGFKTIFEGGVGETKDLRAQWALEAGADHEHAAYAGFERPTRSVTPQGALAARAAQPALTLAACMPQPAPFEAGFVDTTAIGCAFGRLVRTSSRNAGSSSQYTTRL